MPSNRPLHTLAEEFINYKQSLGLIYETPGHYLHNYIKHAESQSPGITTPGKDTMTSYLSRFSDLPGSLYNATAVLREFGKYLSARGYPDTYVIPAKSNPAYVPEPPYFFTTEEINQFFSACDSVQPHPSFPGRDLTLPVLFRLLYCCGLRCKEVRTLLHENVHPDECFLDIIQSKGPKSRRIYISDELSLCLKAFEKSICLVFPERKYFFPVRQQTCYGCSSINANFRRLWMKAFPEFELSSRPRAYDFRHHFVWANLNRWAREGIDINVMLPYLMRYMGHKNIKSTLYYFHFVTEFFPEFALLAEPLESILPEVPYEEE